MQNSYLEVFSNQFFNIEDHEDMKNIIEQASTVLDSIITKFGELINEMTEGTSRKDDFIDTVIILFIRKIMEQLDAINVLYSIGSFAPAEVIIRSLLEHIIQLEFILKEDTQKRAAAYFLNHHYQEIEIGELYFNAKSEWRQRFIAQNGKDAFDKDCALFEKKAQALSRLIHSNQVFQEVDEARKKKLVKKKNRNGNRRKVHIQWYETCSNITSVFGLMKETGYEKYYDSIYGGLSFEIHGHNATMGLQVNENGLVAKMIRRPEGNGSAFGVACNFSIGVLQKIYLYLEDGENEMAEFKDFFEDYRINRDIAVHKLDMMQVTSNNAPE